MLIESLFGSSNTQEFLGVVLKNLRRINVIKGVWGSSPRKFLNDYMQNSAFFDTQWNKFRHLQGHPLS